MGILDKDHGDWPWPFNKIPRRLTAFFWGKPVMLWGNQTRTRQNAPAPIGEAGSWQISYFPEAPGLWKLAAWYVAFTLQSGRHFRLGARWDDVDNYIQWPSIATRYFPPTGEGDRDTST